jgi:hypothetical protein
LEALSLSDNLQNPRHRALPVAGAERQADRPPLSCRGLLPVGSSQLTVVGPLSLSVPAAACAAADLRVAYSAPDCKPGDELELPAFVLELAGARFWLVALPGPTAAAELELWCRKLHAACGTSNAQGPVP